MIKTYADIQEYLIAQGLDHEKARSTLEFAFGPRVLARLEAAEDERQSPAALKKREDRKERETLRQWRRMIADVRKKRLNALAAAKRQPHEAEYHELVASVCERVQTVLSQAEIKAMERVPPATPVQVGAERRLPNSGLHWPDWVPPHIKERVEARAAYVGLRRGAKARPPRPFHVSSKDDTTERKRTLEIAALHQRDAASLKREELVRAVDGDITRMNGNVRRQYVFLGAEIDACARALRSLPVWPRTRPVPVNHMDLVGTRMSAIADAVDATPTVSMQAAEKFRDLDRLAADAVTAARKKTLGRKRYVNKAAKKDLLMAASKFDDLNQHVGS